MVKDLLALFGISLKKKDAGTQAQSAKQDQVKKAPSKSSASYPHSSTKFSGSKPSIELDNTATNMLLMSAAVDSGNSRSTASHDTGGSRSCGGNESSRAGGGGSSWASGGYSGSDSGGGGGDSGGGGSCD